MAYEEPTNAELWRFVRHSKRILDILLWLAPTSAVVLGALMYFVISKPLAQIEKNTEELGPLKTLPKALESTEGRLVKSVDTISSKVDGLVQRVTTLETIPASITRVESGIAENKTEIVAATKAIAATTSGTDDLKKKFVDFDTRMNSLERLHSEMRDVHDSLGKLTAKITAMPKASGGRRGPSFVLPIAIKKPNDVAAAENGYRPVRFFHKLSNLPPFITQQDVHDLEIEKVEIQIQGDRARPLIAEAGHKDGEILITVWTPVGETDVITKEISEKSTYALLTVSLPAR